MQIHSPGEAKLLLLLELFPCRLKLRVKNDCVRKASAVKFIHDKLLWGFAQKIYKQERNYIHRSTYMYGHIYRLEWESGSSPFIIREHTSSAKNGEPEGGEIAKQVTL